MPSEHSYRGAKRAREARADLGYTREGPLPDLLEALELKGGAHVVVLALPDGVAGAYIAKPDCPLLFVNGHQAIARQRFTLAHEFGHHRMGHATVIDKQATISGYSHDPKEVCANAFAAEFLMPKDAVAVWGFENLGRRPAVTLEHVLLLACEYGVSAQAARYALENAKVLTDGKRCAKLDEEIKAEYHLELMQRLRLGWPQDELADAVHRLPRIPSALRNSALGDLLAGTLNISGLADSIDREPEAVSAMLAELGIDQLLPATQCERSNSCPASG